MTPIFKDIGRKDCRICYIYFLFDIAGAFISEALLYLPGDFCRAFDIID